MPKTMTRFLWLALVMQLLPGAPLAGQNADPTVFITETGRRYHRDGCTYLERTRIPIALSEAVVLGYTPCGLCNPPTLPASARPSTTRVGIYRVNVAGLKSYTRADPARMLRAVVVRHIDGDTVYVSMPNPPPHLANYESVRLIGVDTPETVHPNKPVQRFGREASEFTRRRLLHKTVYLAFDWNLRDAYGRLLAYLYLPGGSCHNADLIREGYGHAYTRYPFQFLEEFRRLERSARQQGRGLWAPRR
jgi:endonuclease YncB( thermonuclease family)